MNREDEICMSDWARADSESEVGSKKSGRRQDAGPEAHDIGTPKKATQTGKTMRAGAAGSAVTKKKAKEQHLLDAMAKLLSQLAEDEEEEGEEEEEQVLKETIAKLSKAIQLGRSNGVTALVKELKRIISDTEGRSEKDQDP